MTVHVVGAGLAGLAAAVRLAGRGQRVVLYEAAPQAGGRCRSYFDKALGVTLDNGNHLLLSANRTALAYLAEIGAAPDALVGPPEARFPFCDLVSGQRWTLAPGRGRLPFWLLRAERRIPGTRPLDYLDLLRLARAGPGRTVAEALPARGALWRRFWQPLAVAVLNTQPQEGSAQLLWQVLRESFLAGEAGCRPLIARETLAAAFVDPALRRLDALGGELRLGWRLRQIERSGEGAQRLVFDEGSLDLGTGDRVVLAVSPWVAAELLPELGLAFEPRPIVNAHLLLPEAPALPPELPILGLVGGTAEWLFARNRLVSLTVSAAEGLADVPRETLAQRLWYDVRRALSLPEGPLPPLRLVVEKRATFAATPRAAAQRPGPQGPWPNLLLAGDYTATRLPATIEGALRSGMAAAACLGATA